MAMDHSELYALYESDPMPIVSFLSYLRESYGLSSPTTILDMGCGPGRLLRPLAEAGWGVTGYEPDPDYAAAAMVEADALPGVRVREAGLLELDEVAAFDLVALVNGPLSYVLTPGKRREALERCRRALRPNGVLFMELANFPWILRNYRPPPQLELEVQGMKVLRTARHEIDYHSVQFTHVDRFTWTDRGGKPHEVEKTHRMAMVLLSEIEHYLTELGFVELSTFNEYEDREPGLVSGKRLMVSARLSGS